MSFLNYLLCNGYIDNGVYNFLCTQYNNSKDIDDIILSTTGLLEDDLIKLKVKYYKLVYTDLDNFVPLDDIDYSRMEKLLAVPFDLNNNTISIAINDPENLTVKDKINYYITSISKFRNVNIKYFIAKLSRIQSIFQELLYANDNAVTKIINDAIKANASDIHITPFQNVFVIMFRVDGELVDYKTFPISEYQTIAVSLKVKSKFDISENRRPQSGQFCINQVDFRLSTHPTIYGENIVIRILNKNNDNLSIESLGFNSDEIEYFRKIVKLSQGIIIFCGPTGSGKTTSIYSLIELIEKKSRNVMTLEDPIEYKISNVRQTEIKPGVIDFASGVRSILRQDPDVIFIGEIRDEETAHMAIRASMTGHLVFTTIHANDSIGAIFRLKHFNIASSFIAENIITIISQRLVKKASGKGRTIISEILKPNDVLSNLISNNASRMEILDYAINNLHFKTIKEDAIYKAKQNMVSVEELETKYNILL
ncbi:MAG: type II/IV secretion system protein [Alphaproteobacteria bacterium]|nr:type II/IV secretion system protein [Alphaproteobacteria bacterium]